MANHAQPARPLAELLSTRTSAAQPSGYPADAMQKAAQESAVGGLFETLTKEATHNIVGTTGLAGATFGSQVAAAMEPVVTKLAEIQGELTMAVLALTKAASSITSGGIADIGGPHLNVNPAKPSSYPNEKPALPDNAAMGDGVKGWAVAGAIEKLKTQSVTTGTVMSGKKRQNPGQENIGDYPHGKKANDQTKVAGMPWSSEPTMGEQAGAAMEGGKEKLLALLSSLQGHAGSAMESAGQMASDHPVAAALAALTAGAGGGALAHHAMGGGGAPKTASDQSLAGDGKRFQAFLNAELSKG